MNKAIVLTCKGAVYPRINTAASERRGLFSVYITGVGSGGGGGGRGRVPPPHFFD